MKILASRRFPGPAFDELGDVELLSAPPPAGLGSGRPDVQILVTVHEVVDERSLQLLPELKLVANYGVGYDTIDVAACARRGIAVSNTPGVLDSATADLTLALILACRRRVVEGDVLVRRGQWTDATTDLLLSGDVTGAVLGIIGLGRIGQAVARRAHAFEMRVIYNQRRHLSSACEQRLDVEYRELDALLSEVDILTVHCALTRETTGLIDSRRLALLHDGACVVNVARGAIIDEMALVAELERGRLVAGLDVYAHEPFVPERLRELRNVILSPHLGSATVSTREAMTRLLVDNILAFQAGLPIPTPVANE